MKPCKSCGGRGVTSRVLMDQYGPYIARNCARCGEPILVGPSIYLIIWLAVMAGIVLIGYLLRFPV